ncbi:glycine zipper family protein [Carboxylicivirga sp. RSCT41]|uniref:glycine zipper family protein n=1 Tax=Carboxylicivirga agarovorans TaxID=3417570 RepID=UPI003D330EE1
MKAIILLLIFVVASALALAQTDVPTTQVLPDTAKMTYNQISQSGELVVFPSKGQDKHQQKNDEFECYLWALEQTGIDPLNLPKIEAEKVNKAPEGHAVAGAARGAAAGAAIGAIAGDAGKGAAIGATAGALRGRRAKVYGDQQEQQQNNAAAAAAEEEMKEKFKKAFAACMEGKGYTVK